ncbi:hypothetical protein SDC9_196306 [bioreactor metagenome]|uniref:Uncharacterized protein n=1 Tax=bioreactor metagenome TaxID=1076179 RepID=A0A645IK53_9ZZZZ
MAVGLNLMTALHAADGATDAVDLHAEDHALNAGTQKLIGSLVPVSGINGAHKNYLRLKHLIWCGLHAARADDRNQSFFRDLRMLFTAPEKALTSEP